MALAPIFSNSELELCTAPLPTGYPNSWTHPGIAYSQSGYNGYKYFLASSPYPSGNDSFENPMFHFANERDGGLPPKDFIAFSGNPLQEDPGNGYNADPDILFIGSDLYITNRPYLRSPLDLWVNVQKATIVGNEFIFSSPIRLYSILDEPINFGYPPSMLTVLISPSFIEYNGKIRSYHLVTNVYGHVESKARGLVIMEGDDLNTENGMSMLKQGSILGRNIEPWHLDVFEHGGKLYAIICGIDKTLSTNKANQYLAVSDDFENFRVYPKPLSTIQSYRGTAFVREDGLFVMYTSTVGYRPAGDISADGRNILLGYKDFTTLLAMM